MINGENRSLYEPCVTFAGAVHDLIGKRCDVVEICQVVDVRTLGRRSDRHELRLSDIQTDTHRKHRHLHIQFLSHIYALRQR